MYFIISYLSFCVLIFCFGAIFSVFNHTKKETTVVELLINSSFGLIAVLPLLYLFNYFLPLKFFFNQFFTFGFLLLGISQLFLFKKIKFKKFDLFLLVIAVLSVVYFYPDAIWQNKKVNFGNNLDFFSHQQQIVFIDNYAQSTDPQKVPILLEQAQTRLSANYRYPAGAHYLLDFFANFEKLFHPVYLSASMHKFFYIYSLILCFCYIEKFSVRHKKLLALFVFYIFSHPLLQSIQSWDFVAQNVSIFLVISILFRFYYKKFDLLYLLLNLGLFFVYQYLLILVFVLNVFGVIQTLKNGKRSFTLILVLLYTFTAIYYYPNFTNVYEEWLPGGWENALSTQEIVGAKRFSLDISNVTSEGESILVSTSYLEQSTRCFTLVLLLILFIVSSIQRDRKKSFLELLNSPLFFICVNLLIFSTMSFFLYSYHSYKIITTLIFSLIVVFIDVITHLNIKYSKYLLVVLICGLSAYSMLNVIVSFPYHYNWYRVSNSQLIDDPHMRLVLNETDKEPIVLIHRNLAFINMIVILKYDRQIYTNTAYFSTLGEVLKNPDDVSNLCNWVLYDHNKVTTALVEQGACEGTKRMDNFTFHNILNAPLEVKKI